MSAPSVAVTRRYRFPAAHVLRHPSFSDAENERVYGKCANPAGHGHDYGIEVTVTGAIDRRSGRVVDLDRLDAVVRDLLVDRLGHSMLNEDPLFAERVPTAENIAEVAHEVLAAPIAALAEPGGPAARLARVRVVETKNNLFDCGQEEG